MLPTHGRYEFSIIDERPLYDWPGGKRLAFYISTNIEYFAFGVGHGWDPSRHNAPQTHRNYAGGDYGNRVGLWRLLDLFDELKLPAAHNINTLLYEFQPGIFKRLRARGDELIAHGRTNSERPRDLWERDEARIIAEVTDAITRNEGVAPQGWMGASAEETRVTPDLLQEAGYKYLMDWPMDDQPIWMNTRAGRILSVPYPVELNDSGALIHRQHSAHEFADMIVDQFDEMIRQCAERPLVCAFSLHPNIVGQPFRLRPLRQALKHCLAHKHFSRRVWLTRPREIAEFCYPLPPGIVPGREVPKAPARKRKP